MAAGRRDEGLQTLALFARLLEAARADSHGEGIEREEIVQLALTVLDLLAPALGAPLCADLRAQAWCEVAGVRREQADLEGAGAAMTAAWAQFREGTGGVDLKALLLGRDAALLAAAGELAAAERLLSTVAALYRRLRDDRREGQALLELAQVAGQLDPDKGAALAERSLPVLRRAGDGRLELAALHRCAWFLIEAGRCREARARLDFARPLERDAGDDGSRFRRLWLEARLAFRLGNGSGARVRFERLLALAERRGLRQELVLVGVDLAAVHAAGGESERCAGVLDSLYPLLVEWRLHLDGLETWVRLQQEVSRRRPDAQRLLRAATRYYLRYWERPPRAREKVVAS